MEKKRLKRLPVGIQTFEKIINNDCLYIDTLIAENERRFNLSSNHIDPNMRLMELIINVSNKTGKEVVILIDEYDAPLLDMVHEEQMLPELRNVMRNFYSPLKGCDPYIKFVFLTGIGRLKHNLTTNTSSYVIFFNSYFHTTFFPSPSDCPNTLNSTLLCDAIIRGAFCG